MRIFLKVEYAKEMFHHCIKFFLIIIIRLLVIKTAFIAQKMIFIIAVYDLSNKISASIFITFLLFIFYMYYMNYLPALKCFPRYQNDGRQHCMQIFFVFIFFLTKIIYIHVLLLYLPNSLCCL